MYVHVYPLFTKYVLRQYMYMKLWWKCSFIVQFQWKRIL